MSVELFPARTGADPKYLLQSQLDAAKISVARLTRRDVNDPAIEQELADIQAALDAELAIGKASYMDWWVPLFSLSTPSSMSRPD